MIYSVSSIMKNWMVDQSMEHLDDDDAAAADDDDGDDVDDDEEEDEGV